MSSLKLSGNLIRDAEGIWVSPIQAKLSYPEDGHQRYFLIEDRSFWFLHRNDCIMAALRRHPPGGPVLDVGGGNGFVTRRMIDDGFPAILLEPGRTGAFNAKTRRDIPEVVCATLEESGFPDGAIDAMGLFDVLEHIEDDGGLLETIYARLRPGGLLYLTVPAFASLWSRSDIDAGHYRRYNPRQMAALLAHRFDILFSTCFFQALVVPIWAIRVLPFRLGFARRDQLSTEQEHGLHRGMLLRAMERVLRREIRRIESGHPTRWGTSLLCIARKK